VTEVSGRKETDQGIDDLAMDMGRWESYGLVMKTGKTRAVQ